MATPDVAIRQVAAANLTDAETSAIRELLRAAFQFDGEGFTDDDWEHASGGPHFLLEQAGAVLAYASVALRELQADGRPLRAGYVEAVATRPDVQGHGHGTDRRAGGQRAHSGRIELGALSTGIPDFYRRLGWELWLGSTAVRTQAWPGADSRGRRRDHGPGDADPPRLWIGTPRSVANGAQGTSGNALTL